MTSDQNKQKEYYTKRMKKLLKRFDTKAKHTVKSLSEFFNIDEITKIQEESKTEFTELIPTIPYVGGRKNFSTNDLLDAAMLLGFYKVLKKRNLTPFQIGQIVYETRERIILDQPKIVKFLTKKLFFSSLVKQNFKKRIEFMKKESFLENWEVDFVEGDGEEFDWGMDFTQCAVCKFYEKHGGEEILPYICLTDYIMFNILGDITFTREHTMTQGDTHCSFRFKKGGETQRGWPPKFEKE